jgi:hypothetical protein
MMILRNYLYDIEGGNKMELRDMTNKEVAKRVYDYLIRIDKLKGEISKKLNHFEKIDADYIRQEYKLLKKSIKKDAHYMSLSRNYVKDNSILQNQFRDVIFEAVAYGFNSAINSQINHQFWDSLEEAEYKLTKFTSIEEWKMLSEEG